jgi:hypothetical protein
VSGDSRWIGFLRGGPDHRGRTLERIHTWGDAELEAEHDYIQWLFPLPEPSPVNPAAPVLGAADPAALAADPRLADEFRRSLERMLAFYGLERVPGAGPFELRPAPSFAARAAVWLTPENHNHLRLTRILRCCVLCGLGDEAGALLRTLQALAAGPGASAFSATTLAYWVRAGGGSP